MIMMLCINTTAVKIESIEKTKSINIICNTTKENCDFMFTFFVFCLYKISFSNSITLLTVRNNPPTIINKSFIEIPSDAI